MSNDEEMDMRNTLTIQEYISEQSNRTPDAAAVEYDGTRITYGELEKQSNQIARFLMKRGLSRNGVAGICMERSPLMIAAMLGVLKAGGAYLPLDPEFPADRLAYMTEDSGADLLLVCGETAETIASKGVLVRIDRGEWEEEDASPVTPGNSGHDLAYVIYTSGSTGRPKGVMIEHRSVSNLIEGIKERIDFSAGRRILGLTTVSFDIFVLETWVPLSCGMTIVLAGSHHQKDPWELGRLITESGVEMIQTTPSRMNWLLHATDGTYLRNVRVIMLGGEGVPGVLVERLSKLTDAKLYNMYGPTETTVWSCCGELHRGEEVHVGRPIKNTRLYIINEKNEVLESGEIGELCIAGDGLARGYWNQWELTEQKFLMHPHKIKERMYKTGDIAQELPDGNLRIIGRGDQQVKIRGYRIELGEIEAVLMEHDTVHEAAVIVKEGEEGAELVAYIAGDGELAPHELRRYLSRRLPAYMLPGMFVSLPKLPVTPNGKIDRAGLANKSESKVGSSPSKEVQLEYPGNPILEHLTQIFASVLHVEKVENNINFFDQGADSFSIVDVFMKINDKYPNIITVSDLFGYTTVEKLSNYILQQTKASVANVPDVPIVTFDPKWYMGTDKIGMQSKAFHFEISKTQSEAAIKFLEKESDLIFALLLMYAISVNSNNPNCGLIYGKENELIPLFINFDDHENLQAMIDDLSKQKNRYEPTKIDLRHLYAKGFYDVIPAYLCYPHFHRKDVFDLRILAKEAPSHYGFIVEFNSGKLSPQLIDKLIDDFAEGLKGLIYNYN